jgi:general secretion pathway protein D
LPWNSQGADINFDVIPLRQASASQLSHVLNQLQAGQADETSKVSITADEHSNSILLNGDRASRLQVRELIKQLDSSTSSPKNTDVIYLRYLQANKAAPILNRIAEQIQEHSTVILAECSTNSLIITSSPSIIKKLHSIIAKLDIRPAQVLVEGIIVEISQEDLKNLGIEWGSHLDKDHFPTNHSFSEFYQGMIGIISHQKIQAILHALQNNRNANILSTPSVVVLDNHRALLDIGQDVPIKNGEYSSNGNTPFMPFNTISYKKVALTLEVIPQINLSNANFLIFLHCSYIVLF